MRVLLSVSAALLCLSVPLLVSGQCVVKSTSVGSTSCTTVQSVTTSIAGTNTPSNPIHILIPTFDKSAFPGAILDAVWVNWVDVDFNPTGAYIAPNGDVSNLKVSISIPATWTFFSGVDNHGFNKATVNSMLGGLSVDPTEASGPQGTTVCAQRTDLQTPPHTTQCLSGPGIGLLSQDLKIIDDTFKTSTLPQGVEQPFKANYAALGTYTSYQGPTTNTATSGIPITSGTPASAYSTNTAGTWPIMISSIADLTTPTTIIASNAFDSTSATTVTVTSTLSLTATFQIQYDYHFGSIQGDPQFNGFQGQNFQVHGAPDSYFALISASNYYVNARFDYLSTGKCDYNETACFTHPGTYMGLVFVGMKGSNIVIQAGPHATGFAGVFVSDKPVHVGDRISLHGISAQSYLHKVSHSKLVLSLDNVLITIHNSDLFVNFDLGLTDKNLLSLGSTKHVITHDMNKQQIESSLNKWYGGVNPLHGLIGQTWRNIHYPDHKKYQGDVMEYQVDSMKDYDFTYAVYQA